ncbi:hypothetical protein GCM10008967_19970 [Bacillus carboniphilus]|uniref:Uncharacterized protein n=1 Tax=Bacillus carboniphilus TaxID=86663 RepID=A0ABP3FXW8_9BACI
MEIVDAFLIWKNISFVLFLVLFPLSKWKNEPKPLENKMPMLKIRGWTYVKSWYLYIFSIL